MACGRAASAVSGCGQIGKADQSRPGESTVLPLRDRPSALIILRFCVHLTSEPSPGEHDPSKSIVVVGPGPSTRREQLALLDLRTRELDLSAREEAEHLLSTQRYCYAYGPRGLVCCTSLAQYDEALR
jgi:hypothetical protein